MLLPPLRVQAPETFELFPPLKPLLQLARHDLTVLLEESRSLFRPAEAAIPSEKLNPFPFLGPSFI